ncbi:hypothetical protein ASPSYDRAFT_712277 [Aspergillus sydowii CBS 593.65]|uniref:Uncharacterized protein n=1 Tax=Aspergillus sydowii CBS 593.65 TaxID=1036612 RepID=A0A1L9SYP7_9EURO|nr:uncharacterized protein ASPSYDRAFT_712277 [Aspergillus sydowii CBS 593.65]OJJ52295.1 hypothetical protein ASPSYDRAFT_712277 [Aspergillus sydowii CBS 593.65]
MMNNSCSDNGTLITDISDYQSQLLSMAQHSSSPVQLCTPPPTPPPSPAADNGSLSCQDRLTVLPTQILKHPARLAIECYHRRKFSKATLPKATLYEYSRNLAEEELDEQELYILSIFTWHVNGSVPVKWLLQQSHQLAASSIELSESDRKALSETFSQTMIDNNCFQRQDLEDPGLSGLLPYSLTHSQEFYDLSFDYPSDIVLGRLSKAFMKSRNWMSLRSLFSLSWMTPLLWIWLFCLFSLWILNRQLAAMRICRGEIRVGSQGPAEPP